MTHYIPAFTVRNEAGLEQAVCGLFITPDQHVAPSHTPDCWGCALWLHEVEHPTQRAEERARVLARITDSEPYGVEL